MDTTRPELPVRIALYARIAARYVAGGMVALGLVAERVGAELATNPDFVLAVGLALSAAIEALYALAKRLGWPT